MAYIKDVQVGSDIYLIEPALYIAPSKSGAAYTATLANFSLMTGATVQAKFAATNNENATLNVNSTGAKEIHYNGEKITANQFKVNHVYTLLYDGTQWQVVGDIDTNTNTWRGIQDNLTSDSTTESLSAKQGKVLKGLIDAMDASTPAASGNATAFIDSITQTDGKITSITKKNIPTVSSSTAGLAPKGAAVSTQSTSTKFLREDGAWATPSYITNTDEKVAQSSNTEDKEFPIILKNTDNTTNETNGVKYDGEVTVNPSKSKITATTIQANSRLVASKAISQIITGTGTAGSYTNSTYHPAKWTFNTGLTATDGDIFTIKIPVAGHDYGVFMSVDNGSHYYPVVLNGTGRITTHYPVNTYLTVIFEPTGSAASMYAVAGQTSSTRITVTGGVWRVLNYYDSNSNDTGYYHRRIYPNLKAGTGSVDKYTIIMQLPNGRWSSIVQAPSWTTNSSGSVIPKDTGKSASTNGFMLGHVLLMYANATYADGANIGTYNIWSAHTGLIDARYSFNLANSTGNGFVAYTPVYIVGTVSDGLFHLDTTKWWTQTLPSSDDGKVYIYIGDAYDWYRITFTEDKPMYWYKDGALRLYAEGRGIKDITRSGTTFTATRDDGSTFTFTQRDNNTTYTFANGTNGFTVTPSGGTAQTVTVTPSIANNITGSGTANYLTKFTGANTIGNSGLTTDTNNNLTIPGSIYFGGNTSSGKALFSFNATYPKHGIWYKDAANDIMSFSASGNADSGTSADFAIENKKLYNLGNIIPNTGNNTGTVGSTSQPVYVDAGQIKTCSAQELRKISLGSENDHSRSVIALCELSAQNTAINSNWHGKIYRTRFNGLMASYYADVDFNAAYGTANGFFYSLHTNSENTSAEARTGNGYRACVFKYNDKYYGGLEFAQGNAASYYGDGTGTFTPFSVAYYSTDNNGTILNEEINSSLTYSTTQCSRIKDKFYGTLNGNADTVTAANLTTTSNAIAYYTNTTGTFGSKASANGALYATSANGALQWGTLPIAQGGTGKTTANDAANALISSLPTWTASPTADTYFIRRDTSGTSTFGQVKFSSIANITNGKITLGPYSITPVTSVNGHTGSSVSVTAADLGLSKAMRFIGVATVAITDGSTTDPVISGYNTKTAGDVIIDKDSSREYVWSTTNKWELLGGDSSYKTIQTAVSSPTASGSTTAFIDTISQDENGVITVTKKNLDTSGTWSGTAAQANYLHPFTDGTNASGTTDIQILTTLQADDNIPRSAPFGVLLQHGNHSVGFGYFYPKSSQYGGWYIANYGGPSYIGLNNGTWKTYTFLTNQNYTSYAVAKTAGVTAVTWDSTNNKLTRTINGTAADVVTAAQISTALGLGTIASKAENDYMKFGGDDTNLGSGSPAATAKTYWADTTKVSDNMITGYYNHSGTEYSLLFSKRSTYGTILKWTYNDTYIRILRIQSGTWKSDDWEKISAGYADSAGTATTATNLANNPSIQTSGTTQITITAGGKTSSAYTVPYATSAGSATTATYIRCRDTRNTTLNPTDLDAATGVRFDFKAKATIDLTTTDAYAGVMSFRPYAKNTDWSGGNAHQLAFNSEGLHWRNGSASWGNWYQILDSNNTVAGSNNAATLTWNTTYTIAKINDVDIKFTTMAKPSYAFTDLTEHPTTLSGYGITDAASNSHSHTLKIGNKSLSVSTSEQEWNVHDILYNENIIYQSTSWDIITPGIYAVTNSSHDGSGHPGSTAGQTAPYAYGHLIVTRANGYGAAQIYISHTASGSKAANKGIRYRSGWNVNNTSKTEAERWQEWATILDDKNFNLYAPTLTGTGASGSWDISITGTAAQATADASGNTITTTYAPLASPALTGTPTAPTAANGTNTTQIATTAFVNNTLSYANAMRFKGTLGTGGTITALPASHEAGDTYRVITAGTWAGQYCEEGTLIICVKDGAVASNDDWTSVETNEDGAVIGPSAATDNGIVLFSGNTGRIIKNSSKTLTTTAPSTDSGDTTIPTSKAVWTTVNTAITGLDFTAVGGDTGEYISKISQTDGKISATKATTSVSNTWAAGTTAGPTIKTTVNGITGTAVAIPSASNTASGVITTGEQTFAGIKTFANTTASTSTDTGAVLIGGGLGVAGQVTAIRLAANGSNTSYNLYVNGTSLLNGSTTVNGNLIPGANNTKTLGSTSARWSKLYIGTADTHGDAYTPIYWNDGVPTAVTPIQYCAFTINSGKTGVKLTHAAFTAASYVTQIVVTSGESNLNSTIAWESAAGYINLTCSATSGAVSGYILVSRGGAVTATATDIT